MFLRIKHVLSFFVLFTFLAALNLSAELPIKNIDQTIDKALKDWNIASLAIVIVKDGQVVHLRGYGTKNIDDKTPVDENTIFGLGSTSKAFGAATIGVLVHEGKLNWDDKVIDHLPADVSPSLPLDRYTGVYTHPIFENITVEIKNGALVLDFDLYPTAFLEHKYLDTFVTKFEKIISTMWDRTVGHELDVTFHVDANAAVTELTVFGLGDFVRVKK